jgi:ketosteroid isomerase-like protein
MNAAGLSFTRILESLTTAPARQFKQGDITGTIERGKRADIVIVEGDPATDLGALTRVTRLYRAGRPIYQATPVATDAAVERLRAIQQELINAWLAQDRPVIERLLAPDWTVTGPTGAISTRATVLADAFDRRIHRLLSGTISDLTVRMIGADGAVVAGRTHATGTYDGVAYTAEIRFTDVFERHAGDWRAVRSHASNIAK